MSSTARATVQDGQLDIDFPKLVHHAARFRGEKTAFREIGMRGKRDLSVAEFEKLVDGYATALLQFGLKPGERVLLLGVNDASAFAALLGALGAGLDAAVTGLHLDARELGQFANATGASAIITNARASDISTSSQVLETAAQATKVRLVLSIAEAVPDGMARLKMDKNADGPVEPARSAARIITRTIDGRFAVHAQNTLITAGLDFIANAQLQPANPIISTIVPASFAGLVCGPIAGLLSGSTTLLHVPFDGSSFLNAIDESGPANIIIPAQLFDELAASSVFSPDQIVKLILLHRLSEQNLEAATNAVPPASPGGPELVDLFAIGEQAVITEPRSADGSPSPPLHRNHMLALNGREILAIRAITHFLEKNGIRSKSVTLEGAAVSQAR